MGQRMNSLEYVKVLSKPMKFLLRVRPRKEMGDGTRQRKKSIRTRFLEQVAKLLPVERRQKW